MKILKKYILAAAGALAKQHFGGKQVRNLFSNYHINHSLKKPLEKRMHFPFQVFVYHRVLPEVNPFAMDVIPAVVFQRQVEILHRYFRVVSLEQAVAENFQGSIAPNTVCLTFDDGYKDNYEIAFPILKKYHMPATIFLTTDFIGEQRMLWHDQVLAILENTEIDSLTFEEANIVGRDIRNPDARVRVSYHLLSWLKKFPPKERDSRILDVAKICRVDEIPAQGIMLNWAQVREMHRNGIDFGAHTKSHPILSLLDNENLLHEIGGSKDVIEEHLQSSISSFAYPNGGEGDFGPSAKRVLNQAGFKSAVTTIYGLNSVFRDAFELLRCPPWEHNVNRFLGRLLFERFMHS